MRFYTKGTGDTREVTKFALFPIKVGRVIYWLEKITIHQSFNTSKYGKWSNDYVVNKR